MVTAAHVVEPILPGGRDSYINLGRFYDCDRLEKRRGELKELTRRYKQAYSEAYGFLSAAGQLKKCSFFSSSDNDINAAVKKCLSLCPVPQESARGSVRSYFLDSFCCQGQISLNESILQQCDKIFGISASENDSDLIIRKLGTALLPGGYSLVYCPAPLSPALMRHLIIPELGIAFTSDSSAEKECAANLRIIRNDAKKDIIYDSLLSSAVEMLGAAKRAHDALEEVYNPCVDFSGIYAEADKHVNTIF